VAYLNVVSKLFSYVGLLVWQWIWMSTVLSWKLRMSLWKSGNNLQILGASRVTWNKFHIQESQILGAIVRNFVAWATWIAIIFANAVRKIKWQDFELGHCCVFPRLFSRYYLWFNLTTNNDYSWKSVIEKLRTQSFQMSALPNEPPDFKFVITSQLFYEWNYKHPCNEC